MTDTTTDPRLGIGGNRERIDKLTRDELIEDHGAFMTELDELRKRKDALPNPVPDDATQAIVTVFAKDVRSFLKRVDDKRQEIKDPYGKIVDAIDGFFNGDLRNVANPLKTHAETIGGAYITKKDNERRAEEARKAKEAREAEEARLAAAAAAELAGQNTAAETMMRQAEAASAAADRAEAKTQAPGVTLGRTYSSGGTAFGRKEETITIDREKIDLNALRPYLSDDVLKAAIKARRRVDKTDIVGVTIGEITKAGFR